MRAYLFPGQGSQHLGMGTALFDLFPEYMKNTEELLGYSLSELCMEDKNKQLQLTQYTQPALYVVNALSYLKTLEEAKEQPDYVAGHSLGEYNALFAAGVFDFATGLSLVKKRGELMGQAKEGAMAAVLGLTSEELYQMLKEEPLSNLSIANVNSYQQLVISGLKKDIEAFQNHLASLQKGHFIPLSVSGAFHSPYMEEASQNFANFLNEFHFATPNIPVIANVNAQPYHPALTKINLINQIIKPVQWVKTIEYLQAKPGMNFQEIGPGTVLSGLLKRIKNNQ